MPTTDPTPLEDALRNLGDELSAAGRPTVTAGQFIARHLHVTPAGRDRYEAAVDHAVTVRHGPDWPCHDATVRLMTGSKFVQALIDYASSEARRDALRWQREAERLRRINLGALHYAAQIEPNAGPGVIAYQVGNVKLLLGDSRTLADGDPYDAALEAISQQAPGHPEETP